MDMMEESFQYWNSVLGRLVSFTFCLKLINNMQGGSDIFSAQPSIILLLSHISQDSIGQIARMSKFSQ